MILSTHRRRYLFYATEYYAFPILRPLQRVIRARGDEVAWFLTENIRDAIADDEQQLDSVQQVKHYSPLAVLTPANVVPHFFPGVKVQVFHGFNARKRSRGRLDSHFALRGFFDLYCTQGPSTTSVFSMLAEEHGYFKVVETGWPKMDPLFTEQYKRSKNNSPVVILTSTFSRQLSCAMPLLEQVKKLIEKGDKHWLVQFHPKMSSEVVSAYRSIRADNYQFIDTSDVLPYLMQADVMVCDTSSVLQEFLQLHRPVVTYKNRTPGPWLIDIDEPQQLERAINRALQRPEPLMEEINRYNRDLHPYTDGQSSQRVLHAVDELLASGTDGLTAKPINLIRKIKLRKQLGYWGI